MKTDENSGPVKKNVAKNLYSLHQQSPKNFSCVLIIVQSSYMHSCGTEHSLVLFLPGETAYVLLNPHLWHKCVWYHWYDVRIR